MDIVLPEVPLGIVTILGVISVYVTSWLNALTSLTGWPKRFLSVALNAVLTVVAMAGYYWITKEPIPDAPTLILVGIAANQIFYGLIGKNSAKTVEHVIRERREDKQLIREADAAAAIDPGNEHHDIVPANNPDTPSLESLGAVAVETEAYEPDAEALEIERITAAELAGKPLDSDEFVVDAHTGKERRAGNHE